MNKLRPALMKKIECFICLILTVLSSLLLSTCGGEWHGLQYFASPSFTTTPSSIDFGYVTIGGLSTSSIEIHNNTREDLEILNISLTDAENFSLDTNGGSTPCGSTNPTIPAGEVRTVSVYFSPSSTESCYARLTIESSQPDAAALSVSLIGTGSPPPAPVISTTPTNHVFGARETGIQSEPAVITITNSGTADLDIFGFYLSDMDNYSLDTGGGPQPLGTAPATILPGQDRTVTVTFSPKTEGVLDADIEIATNDPETPTAIIHFSGAGEDNIVPDRRVTLTWQAPETNIDGTPATDIAGYIIYSGESSGNYTDALDVGLVYSYTLEELPAGTLYFSVTAYDDMGNESDFSNEGSKTFN